jgi:hypothetical protein
MVSGKGVEKVIMAATAEEPSNEEFLEGMPAEK